MVKNIDKVQPAVLNLIISRIPSILKTIDDLATALHVVLNLVISGIPSILRRF